MTSYTWNGRAPSKKVHVLGAAPQTTLCKLENAGTSYIVGLDSVADEIPRDRVKCIICFAQLWKAEGHSKGLTRKQRRKQSLKVGRAANLQKRVARQDFYSSWEWAALRYDTLKHYGAKCMLCGSNENIVVDHIKPRSRYPTLELDPNNLQVLCDQCNRGKSNRDETDFRPAKPEPELAQEQMEHLKAILQ